VASPSKTDSDLAKIDVLTGLKNYHIWEGVVRFAIRGKGLWRIVNGTELRPLEKLETTTPTATSGTAGTDTAAAVVTSVDNTAAVDV